ncbi:MAG: CehA/McbA family metallohydrolase, partial [Turicibacter sp.]|nr:CehA/McbA family metallohydrolase [Turicibacter sp.]
MKTVINHFIPKGKEGTYYTIPFEMPGDIDTAFVHYEYADGVVDLGIQEEERFLGWSGSNKKTISFGNQAEKGYLSSRLKAGTYYIMVGAYKIPEEGVTVTYTIDFIPKEEKWLSGDIHVHSTASDGQYDTYTLAQKAKSIGLDFLSITDHNNFSENFYLPHVDGVTMILGVEWTHYRGHMNIYGIKDPFDDFVLNSESEMEAFIQKVRARGAVVSVNHPKDRSCPYLWESQSYDLFEIWNGPMRPCNVKALQMWHELLCSGKRVPIVGGSDFHRSVHPVFLGHPITRVLAKSNTPEDIMAALLAG